MFDIFGPLASSKPSPLKREEPETKAPLSPRITDVLTLDELTQPAVSNKEVFKDPRYFSGPRAVAEVERRVGKKLDPRFKHIVEEEGFFAGKYFDDREKNPVETGGVGQTGKYLHMPLMKVFEEKENEVADIIGGYHLLDEDVKTALLSARYRGDMKPTHKWVHYFNNGQYDKAATEFLDHGEYKRRKRKNKNDGVVKRMNNIANTLRSMK